MPEISASEYLNSLLVAYQSTEKVYSQAVSDLVAAEIRRDEAKKAKDEAYSRLEEARQKYANTSPGGGGGGGPGGRQTLTRKNSNARKKGMNKQNSQRGVAKGQSFGKKGAKKDQGKVGNDRGPPAPPPALAQTESDILKSPKAGSKKAPAIFNKTGMPGLDDNGPAPKRNASRVGPLSKLSTPSNVLEIAKGRNRDWYDGNFDCEKVGLVKNFYQAAFGTKTHEKTNKVAVATIVLNDEWNDLVMDTSQIQEMYIGKNLSPDAKPDLRDRAAEALVAPPQKDPVALFFAPKNSRSTNEIFYGGHWRVMDGKMLNPPRSVKGQPRQCLAKFEFAGIDQTIIDVINQG